MKPSLDKLSEKDMLGRPTFIRVDKIILDNYGPAIEGCVLLCLSSGLTKRSGSILRRPGRRDTSRHAEHMAGEKLLRTCKVGVKNVGVAISRGKKDFGGRNQEDLYGKC